MDELSFDDCMKKSKNQLLDLCSEYNIQCYKSWNKTKLCQALTGEVPAKNKTNTGEKINKTNAGTKPKDEQEANVYIQELPVSVTGARPNDIIIGIRPVSKGAIIRLTGATVPPYKRNLDKIRAFPILWQKFLNKLGAIAFFADMNLAEREQWLAEHEVVKDLYISDVNNSKLELLQVGKSDFIKLEAFQIEKLLSGEELPTMEVQDMFPRKPGSAARRQTLIFNRSYWKISVMFQQTDSFPGLVFDPERATVYEDGVIAPVEQTIFVFSDIRANHDIGLLVSKTGINLTKETLFPLILDMAPSYTLLDIQFVENGLNTYTAAGYKSLMQKIIRFRPSEVEVNGKNFHSGFVLLVGMALLLINPGSFVPDIQRYVTGLESLTKRLAITILEDSYATDEMIPWLMSLILSAFLAQRVRSWKPTMALVQIWFQLGLMALYDSRNINYNIQRGIAAPAITLDKTIFEANGQLTHLNIISAFLDILRSFESDLGMVRDIANNYPNWQYQKNPDVQTPKIMPIIHSVDHHWVPEIVYFYDSEVVKSLLVTGSKPFNAILNKLFTDVTGINPRKNKNIDYATFEELPFVISSREAQHRLLLSRQVDMMELALLDENTELNYILDKSWIAGMLGPIEIKSRPKRLVTLDPSQPERLVVIRKPTRDMKNATLTVAEEESAILEARQLLINGIIMKASKSPIAFLEKAKLFWQDDEYYVEIQGTKYSWEQIRNLSLNIPLHDVSQYPNNWLTLLSHKGEGIDINSQQRLNYLIENTESSVLQRALMYLSGFKSQIELNRISRDGGYTKQAVVFEDVPTYKFLLELAFIYPIALRRVQKRSLKFTVPNGPMLWTVRDYIAQILAKRQAELGLIQKPNLDQVFAWGEIKDQRNRQLWQHQVESLATMIDRHNAGKKKVNFYGCLSV